MSDIDERIDVSAAVQEFLDLEDRGLPSKEVDAYLKRCAKLGKSYVAALALELNIMASLRSDDEIRRVLKMLSAGTLEYERSPV
ncbi:MAG: hypothetical protein GY842_01740 [bacterium]|nr:hypothetical protein [bacterium]